MLAALLCALQAAPSQAPPDRPRASASAAADVAYAPVIASASDEGRSALARIQVPSGFQVDLFAAEPMLANPVCLWIDRRGTSAGIYVAETFRHHKGVTDLRDHMDWLDLDVAATSVADRIAMKRAHAGEKFSELYEVEHERIRLLRDTDGDGAADVATVFADGFKDAAAGIGAGLFARGNEITYACIPDLWRLSDRDGDGRADERRVLSTGYGVHVAMLGHDLHGLALGPDGRLYFSCGDRGLRVETPKGAIDATRSGSVLRCELDGSDLELFATGLRNPQELAFDDYGDLFTGDNNSDGGDSARFVHVVEGSDSGWRYGYQWLTEPVLRGPWNEEDLWKPPGDGQGGQAAYLLSPIANFSHGPSGFTAYPGTGFGDAWRGRFFLIDFEGTPGFSGIDSFRLERAGASFRLVEPERFAWRFCVTDCDFGPDGALYACDWVDGWQAPGKGRIYRISHASLRSHPIVAEVARLLADGMRPRAPAELAALLAHPDRRVRQEAHLELAARGSAGMHVLRETAQRSVSLLASLHAIWGMGVACRADSRASRVGLVAALADADAEVRAQAARVLGDLRERSATPLLLDLLMDPSPRVRAHSAIALGRLEVRGASETLIHCARAADASDPVLRHAIVMGLSGCATTARLLEATEDRSVNARLAAVVALRRRGEARVAWFLDDESPRVRLEAARAIYDEPIPAAFPELAETLDHGGKVERHLGRRALAACLSIGTPEQAIRLARFATDPRQPEELRAEALAHLASWSKPGGRDPFMGEWRPRPAHDGALIPTLVAMMAESLLPVLEFVPGACAYPDFEVEAGPLVPPRVAAAYVELAGEIGARELAPRLGEVAGDLGAEPGLRASAIAALGKLAPADLEATLCAVLFDAHATVRAAALRTYQGAFPGRALPLLASALERGELEEKRAALQGLGGIEDPAADELLLEALASHAGEKFPPELALDLTLAAEARPSAEVKAVLKARAEERKAAGEAVGAYLDCQFGGDSENGRKVFRENASLACLKCHRAPGEEGGVVGPDLAGVGQRLTRLQLLEAILEPNRTLSAGYEGVVFTLADETYVEGSIVAETAETVRVLKADGTEIEIPASEITGRRKGLSAMPDGMRQYVSRENLRDLIEYLGRL